ncbi:MAG: exonuclease subunit SbcD [Aquificaceae bacterium]
MKVLHISDLHAGKYLNNISRNQDLDFSLKRVIEICKEEKVKYVLISGDIFDRKKPDSLAIEIVNEFLVRLQELGVATVMIGGNHDDFDYLKAMKPFAKLARVFIVDRPKGDISKAIVDLGDLCVACLPYPSPGVLTDLGENISERERIYANAISKYFQALEYHTREKKPRILMSHIFISGAKFGGGEISSTLSPEFSVPASAIPYGFDYVALGHLHKFQKIKEANSPTYYSGSLFQMDFGESQEDKFVIIVEFKDFVCDIREIRIPVYRNLVSITLNLEDVNDQLFEKFNSSDLYKITLNIKKGQEFTKVADILKSILGERLVLRVEVETMLKRVENLEYRNKPLDSLYEIYLNENNTPNPEEYLLTFRRFLNEASKA